MPARSDEPRRDGKPPRRGAPRTGAQREGDGTDDGTIGGISDARAYTPRGRTVREAAEQRRTPRATRDQDPFRPALQVLDGGRAAARTARTSTTSTTSGAGRPVAPRPARGVDVAKPPAGSRRRPAPTGRDGTPGRPSAAGRPAGAGRRPPRRPLAPPRLADPRRRLRLGTLLALAMFAVIGLRLVAIQVVSDPAFADAGLADRQRAITLNAPRGAIYDRSGVALAHSVEARYVYADPTMIKDPAATAAALQPLLGIPASELAPRMARQKTPDGRDSQFEYLARGVKVETAQKIMKLELPGIGTDRDERREVPGGDLAANLLGFVSRDMNGLEGLEARYDALLRGVNGRRVFEAGNGDLGAEIPGGYHKETPAKPGSSLALTLDRDLQFVTQGFLYDRMKATSGSTGAAIVMDAHTGEVLAQASYPTYDAADPGDSDPTDRQDAASSFIVDPGSVHKAITIGAALQEGTIKPDDAVEVAPSIMEGDTPFADTHPFDAGTRLTLPAIMAFSSNVGTIEIAKKLGPQKLYEYQRKFGLGQATGEGVAGEAPGALLDPKDWSGSSYGSVPIGMSVDATPLQMAAAYAAIANNGTWVQPHLIKETIGPDGKRTPAPPPQTRAVLSPENAAAMRTILEAVTTIPGATGHKAAIPGYRVAGKTGTGKRLVDGKYAPGEVASFIGMAPADNPRYVVAVFAYTPKGEGGDVSAPAFKDIMEFTLRHYGVPPTGTKPPNFVVSPR